MSIKKLPQREIEANWQAVKDFLKICVIDVDNGNTMRKRPNLGPGLIWLR